jgi:hypothetical protein
LARGLDVAPAELFQFSPCDPMRAADPDHGQADS